MRLELGTSIRCTDGELGELADLVIDPTTKRVTHLVVRPEHPSGPTRLVPVARARPGEEKEEKEISLDCTVEDALKCESVQEVAYLRLGEFPVEDPDWDVGVEDVLAMPYYGNSDFGSYAAPYEENLSVSYDRVPKGKVEIRRASAVTSADGEHVGHVDGFVVDREDQITHVVLERGHLWRKRDVTIPIGAVTKVETDKVVLDLTKDDVGELPSVPVHRWRG
jgi:sporulation protein YlmC with PRC-barrel domain